MSKIAGIYWDTSSVGGIATEADNFRRVATAAGDTFHVIRCPCHKTSKIEIYDTPQMIRGGDTWIAVDGTASHHPNRVAETVKFLEENYDAIIFIFPCPHATKAYGNVPYFLPLYTDTILLPKMMRILDAYWSTYADWGTEAAQYCDSIVVNQAAYAEPLKGTPLEDKLVIVPKPFSPFSTDPSLKDPHLLVWPNQWKAIKGIKPFLKTIPDLPELWRIELYSCGIEYYQLRTTVAWQLAVWDDHFKDFSAFGRANYYGYVTLEEMAVAYTRAAVTVDFQGHAVKYDAYRSGSYNNTTVEALYYGALPILHEQARKSIIPDELFLTVSDPLDIVQLNWKEVSNTAMDITRRKRARQWVMDTHSAEKVWTILKEKLGL